MLRRVLPTTATACLLYGAFTLYSLFLTPLFSPPQRPVVEPVPPPNSKNPKTIQARQYLPDEPWAADAMYSARRGELYLYSQNWEKIEPSGEVRFTPFAMIWHRDGEKSGQQPVVVRCGSARLRFEKPFDERTPQPGRIIGGALEGDVHIRGADGMRVDAQNVQFTEASQRLWSDAPLTFAYGPHFGKAMGLELDLIPGESDGDKPAVAGVKIVRLRKNVDMTLVQLAENGKPQETVRVRSAGMFEYHVNERQAAFHHKVHVDHPTGPNEADMLDGELLSLFLTAVNDPGQPVKPKSNSGMLDGQLELSRLRAEGTPAVLTSQRGEVQAKANIVAYDVKGRHATLTDPKVVEVTQKASVLRCPEIVLDHNEAGEITFAQAKGAGQLDGTAERPVAAGDRSRPAGPFHAEWNLDLTMEPDPEQVFDGVPMNRISLRGQALVRQPGQLELRGDRLDAWMVEQRTSTPEVRPSDDAVIARVGGVRPASSPADSQARKFKPRKMLAIGHVSFTGEEMNGTTERLQVEFEEGKLPLLRPGSALRQPPRGGQELRVASVIPGRTVGNSRFREASLRVAPAQAPLVAGGTRRGFAKVDVEAVNNPGPNNADPKKPGDKVREPAKVVADQIRLRIIQDGDKTDVAEVWNDGNVKITQARPGNSAPFELTGEHLHLTKYSEVDQVIELYGTPALIRDQGAEVEGHELHLDRGQSTAKVVGAGRLRLPIRNGPDGKLMATPQPLDVYWNEEMTFDGQVARFVAGVKATMPDSRMTCEQMEVRLLRPIRLASASSDGPEPELKTIVCQENVAVDSRETKGGQLVAIRQAKAWEFTLDQITGETVAKGPPGQLRVWMRGTAQRARLAANAGVQANKPQQTDAANWGYTRIDFAGTMKGNLKTKVTSFVDRVFIVHGPIAQPGEEINPDRLPPGAGWMRSHELRLRQHEAEGTKPAWLEMVATGNAELDGRPGGNSNKLASFHALAEVISYDESKGAYLLTARAATGARLWRKARLDSPNGEGINGKRMEFWPADNRVKMHEVGGIDVFE